MQSDKQDLRVMSALTMKNLVSVHSILMTHSVLFFYLTKVRATLLLPDLE